MLVRIHYGKALKGFYETLWVNSLEDAKSKAKDEYYRIEVINFQLKEIFFMGFYDDFSKGLAIAALVSVGFIIVGILKVSLAMF